MKLADDPGKCLRDGCPCSPAGMERRPVGVRRPCRVGQALGAGEQLHDPLPVVEIAGSEREVPGRLPVRADAEGTMRLTLTLDSGKAARPVTLEGPVRTAKEYRVVTGRP